MSVLSWTRLWWVVMVFVFLFFKQKTSYVVRISDWSSDVCSSDLEVAHGDGLAGSSVNYGPGSHTDWQWIEAAADVLERARLTTLLLPGVGTIHELKTAYDLGVRSVRVATPCTEADISAPHITPARAIGPDVPGFPMLSHLHPPAELARPARPLAPH